MGADLYRKGHDAIRDTHKPEWDRLIAERNAAIDAWERTATPSERAAVNTVAWMDERPYPEHIRDIIARADAVYDAMYPPTHYFRDSYNDTSLFWKLDLSWWQDAGDFPTDEDGYAPPEAHAALLAKVSAPGQLDKLKAIADDEWRPYFIEKYDRLCHFLQACIEAGDPICYSV